MVAKAAAGALEYLPVYRVTNLADCLGRLKDAGLVIVGTAADSPQTLYDTDLTQPLALVIGSEDKGMRPRVRQQCDLVVSIPMAAPEIGSLNAATSGAVALFEARRQRFMAKPNLNPSYPIEIERGLAVVVINRRARHALGAAEKFFGGTGFPACAKRLAGVEARPTRLFIIYGWARGP